MTPDTPAGERCPTCKSPDPAQAYDPLRPEAPLRPAIWRDSNGGLNWWCPDLFHDKPASPARLSKPKRIGTGGDPQETEDFLRDYRDSPEAREDEERCQRCEGDGSYSELAPCTTCDSECACNGPRVVVDPCPDCGGTGEAREDERDGPIWIRRIEAKDRRIIELEARATEAEEAASQMFVDASSKVAAYRARIAELESDRDAHRHLSEKNEKRLKAAEARIATLEAELEELRGKR